jgi:hypothetical protein
MANCRVYPSERRKQPFNDSEAADLRARIKQQERFNRQLAQSPMHQAEVMKRANLRQSVQNEWMQMTGDLTRLSSRNLTNVNDFLASLFGIKNFAGLAPSAYSLAGNVRNTIVKSQKIAANQVLYMGRMLAGRRLDDVNQALQRLLPNVSNDQRAEVLYDLLTVGQIPNRRSLQSQFRSSQRIPQTPADRAAAQTFTEFTQRMDSLGIRGRDLDEVLTMSRDVSNSFEHMAVAASAQGVAIGRLDDIGYLPAVPTDDALLRINRAKPEELLNVKLGNELNLATMHNVSRKTARYVPEDSAYAAKLLGISENELNDLLLDPLEWIEFLRRNVTTDMLDTLVDSGVMAKLPMSSREVFDYMRAEYKLPYAHLNELYITDVNVLMSRYSESLMRSVNSTALINTLLTPKAFDAGWVVSREMVEGATGEFAEFVPIADSFALLANKNQMTIQQLAANIGVDPAMVERLSSTYVHPQVARQWRAILATSVNPAAMASVGSLVLSLARNVNKMVLSNPQFVSRQAYSAMRSSTAAGGSIITLPDSVNQFMAVLNNGIDSARFSDAKVYMRNGEAISERRLFEIFIKEQGASSVPGMVSDTVVARPASVNKADLLIPRNVRMLFNVPAMRRAFGNLIDYTMAHGDVVSGRRVSAGERLGRFSEYAVNQFKGMINDNYTPYAVYAIAVESAAKWNVYRTLTAKVDNVHEITDRVQQIVTAGQMTRFDNGEDLYRHVNEYFVDPFDTGRVNAFISHYIRPFATYAMANPPMQLRHAMRHPHLYLAGQRLHTLVNGSLLDDEKNNEYTIPGWVQEGKPWLVGRNPNGDPYVLMPGNFDGGTDAFVFFNELDEDVRRLAFGEVVGTPEERNAVLRGENTREFINEMASMMHAPWKVMIEQITGREFFSGRSIELDSLDKQRTLVGFRANSRVAHIVENALPAVRMLDALNPFGVFGTAPETDAFGNVINEGRLSVLGTERQRTDEFAPGTSTDNAAIRFARLAGLNIRGLNYDKQYYRSYRDIERTARDMNADLTDAKKALEADFVGLDGVVDRVELERRVNEYTTQSQLLTRLYIDMSRLATWGEARGLPPAEALEQLRSLRVNLQTLPVPAIDQANSAMALERLRSDALFVRSLLERN